MAALAWEDLPSSGPTRPERPLSKQHTAPPQTSINNLQPEILALVFLHYCEAQYLDDHDTSRSELVTWRIFPEDDPGDYCVIPETPIPQILLLSVCKLWRQVVLSWPSLWTTATLVVGPHNRVSRGKLLLQYLKRSGDLPLSISLQFSIAGDAADAWVSSTLVDPVVDSTLRDQRHRLCRLSLRDPPRAWALYVSKIPCLKYFQLNLQSSFSAWGDWFSASEEESGQIDGRSHRSLNVSPATLNHITSLGLSNVDIDICFQLLLQRCPNLVEFRCLARSLYRSTSQAGPWPSSRIVSLKLQRLELFWKPWCASEWEKAFCKYARFPSLRTLSWGITPSEYLPGPVNSFFDDLPSSLKTLEINCYLKPRLFRSLFDLTDVRLENIIFSPRASSIRFISQCLEALSAPNNSGKIMLPHLKAIAFRKPIFYPMMWDPSDGHQLYRGSSNRDSPPPKESVVIQLTEMLEARNLQGVYEGFCIVDEGAVLEWSSDLKERLDRLDPPPVLVEGEKASSMVVDIYYA